ncbi:MAG TPA: GDSL-type esterase/lipase family protein, partial [Bacteroidia bacterium]|nr:GDSL-type esterase/lipase family protein [Bacteroidia bacterium]
IRRIIDSTIQSEHWNDRYKEFRAEPRRKGRFVFMGNSLTELFDLRILGDSTILNRGITGDFSEGLLKRLDEVISLKPSKLFIEIGINDLVEHVPNKEICRNYRALIERVRRESPETRIYMQSLLPVRMKSSIFTSSEDVNETIKEQNESYKKLATEMNVTYINLYDNFVMNNEINPRLTWDGIHLVDEGYEIWKGLLSPFLKLNI